MCTFIISFSVNLLLCFVLFFLSQRHSFSEDTWVKFSNLSEEKIIGTYDTTAHVSKFLQFFFSLRVKAHPYYQGSLLLVLPERERNEEKRTLGTRLVKVCW